MQLSSLVLCPAVPSCLSFGLPVKSPQHRNHQIQAWVSCLGWGCVVSWGHWRVYLPYLFPFSWGSPSVFAYLISENYHFIYRSGFLGFSDGGQTQSLLIHVGPYMYFFFLGTYFLNGIKKKKIVYHLNHFSVQYNSVKDIHMLCTRSLEIPILQNWNSVPIKL